jgi:hypothetical protein
MLATLLSLFAASPAFADDFTNTWGDESRYEVIGWSADESVFAVKKYEIRSSNYSSPMRVASDCPGYTLSDGSKYNGGMTIIALDTSLNIRSMWPIMDANKCTYPEDIPGRLQNADNGLAGLGIVKSTENLLALSSQDAEQGQYFELANERFKFQGEKIPNEGDEFARDLDNRLIFRKGRFEYPLKVRCTPDPGLREPPPADPQFGVQKVVLAPSGKRFVMFQWVKCPYYRHVVIPFAMVEQGAEGTWTRLK